MPHCRWDPVVVRWYCGAMSIASRLAELNIVLPPPMRTGGLPFQLVRVQGNRALVAGHVPLDSEGRVLTLRVRLDQPPETP